MSYGAIVPPNGRGCGSRKQGGVYSEQGMGPGGIPLENFIVDPPVVVDEAALGLSDVGVKLIQDRQGVWHIFDIVGREAYPNVADFLEEARRFGVSRRLPKSLDWSKLTEHSLHILLHRRAWTGAMTEYAANWMDVHDYHPCPKQPAVHLFDELGLLAPDDCCAGFWWNDVEGGEPLYPPSNEHHTVAEMRVVTRDLPSFGYMAVSPPYTLDREASRGYKLAIFYKFHPTRLVVVKSADGSHVETEAAMRAARVDVEAVDE